MTATEPNELICPACEHRNALVLSAGTRLCLDCRHEWAAVDDVDPTLRKVGDAAVELVEAWAATADDDGDTDVDVPAPELVGTWVLLEGGQPAEIVEVIDEDWLRVRVGDDRLEAVSLGDVIRSIPNPEPVGVVELDVTDQVAAEIGSTTIVLAGLMLQAGAGAVVDVGDAWRFGAPASDWLPRDADVLEIVEQAVAYAVASLIVLAGIDPNIVNEIADGYLTQATNTEPEKAGSNDPNASETSPDDDTHDDGPSW